MPHASAFLDYDLLPELAANGYLTIREHSECKGLRIFNYTSKCAYETYWTPEALSCRGLILDGDGNVVARPFQKFFNLSQHLPESSPYPRLPIGEPFIAQEKLDGSLGIAYRRPDTGEIEIATRGSFTSEQAIWATKWWRESPGKLLAHPWSDMEWRDIPSGQTWLFEIIYKKNRIVVDYGGWEEIVLLAVVDNETGLDLPLPNVWVGSVAAIFDASTVDELVATVADPNNFEGFVLRYPSTGQRVKVKLDEYVRLHRILTSCSTKTIWELLESGQGVNDLLVRVPEEFRRWVQEQTKSLLDAYREIRDMCECVMLDPRIVNDSRKDTAAFFKEQKHPAVLFRMLDGKDYAPLIWKAIKPEYARPFVVAEP